MNENRIRRGILEILYDYEEEHSGDQMGGHDLTEKLGDIEPNELIFNMNYLENKGYMDIEEYLEGEFIANITHQGIDLIENNEEFNTKFPLITITNINNSKGVVLGSNNVQIDIKDSINIKDSFNELYKQIDITNDDANEIKENIKQIEIELNKKEVNSSTIKNSVSWLKRNANWTIPTITQIITSVMIGNG